MNITTDQAMTASRVIMRLIKQMNDDDAAALLPFSQIINEARVYGMAEVKVSDHPPFANG